MRGFSFFILLVLCLFGWSLQKVEAQTTEFTFQGRLLGGTGPAAGSHDFEFALFSAATGGTQLGSTITVGSVTVTDGTFTVKLDFGSQFPGASRFLEIRVRPSGGGAFTTLTPRQAVTSAPYALKSLQADSANTAATANTAVNATNAQQLGGIAAGQYILTTDARLSDARAPLPNSPEYIQNRTTQQTASNFNISGTGTANIFNAATQFNIGGNRVLAVGGTSSTFVGRGAGQANTSGDSNSFFGVSAGQSNTTGRFNSLFGSAAGLHNTTGEGNSFFGTAAGNNNTIGLGNSFFGSFTGLENVDGSWNSFFGRGVGTRNTSGSYNSFFGQLSGSNNTTGDNNSFFGSLAGQVNTTGAANSFFGQNTGQNNSTGSLNSFFGGAAGILNTTGSNNSALGYGATMATGALTHATAIGAGSVVSTSSTIALGRSSGADTVLVYGNLIVNGAMTGPSTVAGNIFNAATQYNIAGNRVFSVSGDANTFGGLEAGTANTSGTLNTFFGNSAGRSNTSGEQNTYFGYNAGRNANGIGNSFFGSNAGSNLTGGTGNVFVGQNAGNGSTSASRNVFVGRQSGIGNTTGNQNTFIGAEAGLASQTGSSNTALGNRANFGAANLTNASAIGNLAQVNCHNCMVLGSVAGVNAADFDTSIGIGITAPTNPFTVIGAGTSTGGVSGFNEVVTRFRQKGSTHLAVSLDALTGRDAILYLGENGEAKWGLRYDSSFGGSLQIRSHAGGTNTTRLLIDANGNVGINTTPSDRLHVDGIIRVMTLGAAGSMVLCRNSSNQIAGCSSSIRYKSDVNPFASGLNLVRRLRPVTFNWRGSNQADFGLVAEEVAEVEPLLVTKNEQGQVEGVKYDRVGVVLINAVREQQAQIEAQQKQIDEQQKQIDEQKEIMSRQQAVIRALTAFVCSQNPAAALCQPKEQ